MKFKELFKDAFISTKKASIKFWIICLIPAVLGGITQTTSDVSEYRSTKNTVENSMEYDAITGNLDNFTEEEYNSLLGKTNNEVEDSLVLDSLNNDSFDFDELLDDLNLSKSGLLGLIGIVVALIFVFSIIGVIISMIYKYFLYNIALESIEEDETHNYRNLTPSMGAQILSAISVFLPFVLGCASIILGFTSNTIFFFIAVILFISIPYIAVRFLGVNYVYSKYKDLKTIEIIKKSFEITKGRVLKIILYLICIQFIVFLCCIPFVLVFKLLSTLSFTIFVISQFICNTALTLLCNAFLVMFNVNMFRNLDAIDDINSNFLVDNFYNEN